MIARSFLIFAFSISLYSCIPKNISKKHVHQKFSTKELQRVLPNTKIAVRMPFFKVIQYRHINEKGFGIAPDVYIGTSYEAIKNGYDKKMSVAKEMIISDSKKH